jgi:hypothetical protein
MDNRQALRRRLRTIIALCGVRQDKPDPDERVPPSAPLPMSAAGVKSRNLSALGNGFRSKRFWGDSTYLSAVTIATMEQSVRDLPTDGRFRIPN